MRLSHETVKLLIELGDKEAIEVFEDVSLNPNLETWLVGRSSPLTDAIHVSISPFGWSKGMAYISAYHMGDYSYLFKAVPIET